VPYVQPRAIRVDPPLQRDAMPGYILSRALEAHGRPVAFAFAGEPPAADGSELRLEVPLLRRSLNYRSLLNGHAYPLFYDKLFADLRGALTTAADNARSAGKHLWAQDRSQDGLAVADQADLEQEGVIFPKLFRRLTEFFTEPQGRPSELPRLAQENRRAGLRPRREQLHPLRQRRRSHERQGSSHPPTRTDRVRQRQDSKPSRRAMARGLSRAGHHRSGTLGPDRVVRFFRRDRTLDPRRTQDFSPRLSRKPR
jgi:hypothetical protein